MKEFFKKVERNCISGALLLLPLIVFFVILGKVWHFFQKYGEKTAHLFGLDAVFGTYARDFIGGAFLVLLLYFSGYLMRLAYLKKFTDWVDDKLMIFLPGYEKNKKMAEEKLKARVKKTSTDLPVLLKFGEYWQPAHLIEETADGDAVVFVPNAPSKDHGQIYIVSTALIRRLPGTSLGSFDESVKSFGKGILKFK
ncbi:hypothetical protein EYY60_16200 [Flavobacterium zhairuonense]|uniref:hypothetical protein n=1 Tax=Flavobacterium zhairuonense TaxID=2493631 RepID=UPI00104AAE50|nr:hypothetical protein [Flavobacterium zhairuonense]KAF2508666.1 hypothetical protein EYY60_16200 [Flavobacterium zhairuonense]